ncbi:winged helix DNA-binding domain-containing protein [Sphaerisporangium album]|uniref:Winged helix DNA-binding domain-containing protein n=1 Tax=Sphaerisporangium album TaxID=509200 RepID=A0A367FQ15_9ACTN|nr:winged helix DNA-binding domain-containing protein [Sphaerisporangium album]RCG31797.1 winged helix DNA-binding domain-containing protein [Sphaerisporangium album]
MKLTWDTVLAWRMRRQFLHRPKTSSTEEIVRRLCGIQSQVKSNAELTVAVRSPDPVKDAVQRAVAGKELMRTWAMRGTLHTLSTRDAPAYLSLLAATRTWEKGAWQRAFLDAPRMARLADAVQAELDGAVLSREDLVAAVERRTKDSVISEAMKSGWGAVLKPLAWQGHLCNGDGDDGRITFTSPVTYLPGWPGLPDPEDAARVAIPAYLSAYGPAGPDVFNRWLARGALKKTTVRQWFADLGDTLTEVDVEGETLWIRSEDAESLAATPPTDMFRLLPAFDQYVLGVGTDDTHIIPARHRKDVSRTSGWIAPVVVDAGRVTGVWESTGGALSVTLFPDSPKPAEEAVTMEAAHLSSLLGGGNGRTITIS